MRIFLRSEGLWDIINNPPTPIRREEDIQNNQRALSTIVLCLEDSQLSLVRGIDSAQQCWLALRRAHVRDSVSSRITVTRQLYRLRLQPGGSVSKHLEQMTWLFIQLKEMGLEFSELHKIYIILSSLDESYDVLAVTWEAVPKDQFTLPYICARLREEESKRADNQVARSQQTPSVKEAGPRQHEVPSTLTVKRCFSCGSTSHLLKSCPERKEKFSSSRASGGKGKRW